MSALEIARECWGEDLPDWIEALAVECGRTSQNAVARSLGRSGALISQVLRRKYPADLSAIEERFNGVFCNALLACPALGDLPLHECQDWRAKAREFSPGNPLRTRMFRACGRCARFLKEGALNAAPSSHSKEKG
jgi:hypothetical protein